MRGRVFKAYICDIDKKPDIVIQAGAQPLRQAFHELLKAKSLIYSFALRDFKVRYAQTKLGYAWALIQPLTALAVLYLVFQRALQSDTEGLPFLTYALSGLIFWNFFSYNFNQGASALIQARAMLQKIYFPRQALIISKSMVAFSDLIIALLLFVAVAYSDIEWSMGLIPGFLVALIMAFLASQGFAMWLSALSLRFRDLQQVIPFISQMLFFLSPIAYSPKMWETSLGTEVGNILLLNPLYGILEVARASLLGLDYSLANLLLSFAYCLLIFISGSLYFLRVERKMADLL